MCVVLPVKPSFTLGMTKLTLISSQTYPGRHGLGTIALSIFWDAVTALSCHTPPHPNPICTLISSSIYEAELVGNDT